MATVSVSGVGSAAELSRASTKSGFSALSSEDFTQIILTELSKQDPLQPNDTNALLQQLSTIRSIQSDTDLSDQLSALVAQSDFASAAGLIGRSISGVSEESRRVQGVVQSVSRTDAGPVLTLATGQRVPFGNVDQVDATRSAATTGGGA
jgi:flagellar basal-body rod modification protein FlgD